MNLVTMNGGISREAVRAYTPAAQERVVFEIVTRDSVGLESFWRCEADETTSAELRTRLLAFAQRGARVKKLEAELTKRPYYKGRIHVGDTPLLRVREIEMEMEAEGERRQASGDRREAPGDREAVA